MISPTTAHNDKLGFDWRVTDGLYEPSLEGKHFRDSSYAGTFDSPGFLALASDFHRRSDNMKYAEHLKQARLMFTRSEIPRDPNRPPFSADERYESLDTNQRREVNGLSGEVRKVLENCKRQINGLNEDILEKEEELRILR
jgi:hypothetical protein